MSDRHDITLREADGAKPNPPNLVSELLGAIREAFPDFLADLAQSGVGWFKGKSNQEIAKAMEIRAEAMVKLGNLQIEREKLVNERQKIDSAHKEKMYELTTQRLKELADALKAVKDAGIDLNAKTKKSLEASFAELADPSGP
jgi:hypothetical protein